jgi:hypothetical protein
MRNNNCETKGCDGGDGDDKNSNNIGNNNGNNRRLINLYEARGANAVKLYSYNLFPTAAAQIFKFKVYISFPI